MKYGLRYKGTVGDPATNDDLGLIRSGEVRPIGEGDGELSEAIAQKWAGTGHFEIVEIAPVPDPAPPATGDATTGESDDDGVSVPLLITNAMRAELVARGYDDAAIDAMTPQHAHDALAKPAS